MAHVRPHGNRIQLRFRIRGQELTASIDGPPTKTNISAARALARQADARLRAGEPWQTVHAELRGDSLVPGTVGHYAQHLLDHHAVERSTLIQYQNAYNRVWSGLDRMLVTDVRRSTIERTLGQFDYTPKGQRNVVSVLRQVLQIAVDDGVLSANPCDGMKFKRHQKVEKQPYTRQERDALLATLTGRHHAFFSLAFATGMRTGELLALQPRHLHKPHIRVEQVMAAGQLETRTKTHKPRDVYVPADIWPLLEPLRFQEWLFQYQGKPYHQGNRLMEHFHRAHELAGVDRRPGPYPWRMSYISWMLADGVRPDLVCQQTGHDLRTMLNHYARFMPKEDDGASIERAWK